MLPFGFQWGETANESTDEFGWGSSDFDGGEQCVCAAGCASGERGAGHVAGGESSERLRESRSGTLPEEHGGSGRGDASREIRLQAFAGDEFVRAPSGAHRAVEQYILLEDFRASGAGRKDSGDGSEGKAGDGDEGFFCVLRVDAGEGGRLEAGGAVYVLRKPADIARRGASRVGRKLDGPLRDGSDLFAVERYLAADSAAREALAFHF